MSVRVKRKLDDEKQDDNDEGMKEVGRKRFWKGVTLEAKETGSQCQIYITELIPDDFTQIGPRCRVLFCSAPRPRMYQFTTKPYRFDTLNSTRNTNNRYEYLSIKDVCDSCIQYMRQKAEEHTLENPPFNAPATFYFLLHLNHLPIIDLVSIVLSYLCLE
jgi:hypothetical protein